MSMWCVVCCDNVGGCDFPQFFSTREEAVESVHRQVVTSSNEFTDSKEDYDRCISAQVWDNEVATNWIGFNVADKIADALKGEV